jgi:hypothetical protein
VVPHRPRLRRRPFAAKLFAQLDWSKIERVQLGGLRAGELSFPVSDGTVWWAFAAAASGDDLAPRMAVCPVSPSTPSTGHHLDEQRPAVRRAGVCSR